MLNFIARGHMAPKQPAHAIMVFTRNSEPLAQYSKTLERLFKPFTAYKLSESEMVFFSRIPLDEVLEGIDVLYGSNAVVVLYSKFAG